MKTFVDPLASTVVFFSLVLLSASVSAAEPADPNFSHSVYLQPYAKLRQSAERGDPEAQFDLGYLYYMAGKDPAIVGMPQSYKLAAEWYVKAARQGHSRAQYNMAVLHLQGEGVERDPVEAYAWLLLSSANGHAPSLVLVEELNKVLNEKQIATAEERSGNLVIVVKHP
jgi:hypothetical protein